MQISNHQRSFDNYNCGDQMASCGIIWKKATNCIREAVGYYGKTYPWKQDIIGNSYMTDPNALFFEITSTNLTMEE